MSGQIRQVAVVLVVAGSIGLSGCGNSTASSASPTTAAGPTSAAATPEEQRTSAGSVATGLKKIEDIAAQIAAASADTAKAKELDGQIEPQWRQIEGTVKANDQDAYLAFEDAFAVLEGAADKGDASAASKGAQAVSTSVRGYLARYPG